AAADEVANLQLRPADVDAAVGLEGRLELHAEDEVAVETLLRVKVLDAPLAGVVLRLHDDGPALDLDTRVGRLRLALHRLALLTRISPAGEVLGVEEAHEARLAGPSPDRRHKKKAQPQGE